MEPVLAQNMFGTQGMMCQLERNQEVSRYVVPEPGTVVLGIHAGTKNCGAWYPGTRNCGVCYLGTKKHVARYQKQEPW